MSRDRRQHSRARRVSIPSGRVPQHFHRRADSPPYLAYKSQHLRHMQIRVSVPFPVQTKPPDSVVLLNFRSFVLPFIVKSAILLIIIIIIIIILHIIRAVISLSMKTLSRSRHPPYPWRVSTRARRWRCLTYGTRRGRRWPPCRVQLLRKLSRIAPWRSAAAAAAAGPVVHRMVRLTVCANESRPYRSHGRGRPFDGEGEDGGGGRRGRRVRGL